MATTPHNIFTKEILFPNSHSAPYFTFRSYSSRNSKKFNLAALNGTFCIQSSAELCTRYQYAYGAQVLKRTSITLLHVLLYLYVHTCTHSQQTTLHSLHIHLHQTSCHTRIFKINNFIMQIFNIKYVSFVSVDLRHRW